MMSQASTRCSHDSVILYSYIALMKSWEPTRRDTYYQMISKGNREATTAPTSSLFYLRLIDGADATYLVKSKNGARAHKRYTLSFNLLFTINTRVINSCRNHHAIRLGCSHGSSGASGLAASAAVAAYLLRAVDPAMATARDERDERDESIHQRGQLPNVLMCS